jgi:hypothetical protein
MIAWVILSLIGSALKFPLYLPSGSIGGDFLLFGDRFHFADYIQPSKRQG